MEIRKNCHFSKYVLLRKLGQKIEKTDRLRVEKNGQNLKDVQFFPKPDKMTMGWVLMEKLLRLETIVIFPNIFCSGS